MEETKINITRLNEAEALELARLLIKCRYTVAIKSGKEPGKKTLIKYIEYKE